MHNLIKSVKKSFFLIILLGYFTYANSINIDFYGVLSKDADSNMINMTEDMFIKQLGDFSEQINDKRHNKNNLTIALQEEKNNIILYIDIQKKSNSTGKWISSINIKHPTEEIKIHQKEYDSYYKILVESKIFLSEVFNTSNFIKQNNNNTKNNISDIISTELIAGTWTGENSVNKIVILRGGRGFVIFNNGASMNISISVKTDSNGKDFINIKQTGSSNASFFPEIPRKVALEIATTAKPIEWNLFLFDKNILKGEKHTTTYSTQSNKTYQTKIPVEWKKSN